VTIHPKDQTIHRKDHECFFLPPNLQRMIVSYGEISLDWIPLLAVNSRASLRMSPPLNSLFSTKGMVHGETTRLRNDKVLLLFSFFDAFA